MSNVQRRCATFESSSGHRDISDYHAFLRFAKHEPTDNRVCKQTDVHTVLQLVPMSKQFIKTKS